MTHEPSSANEKDSIKVPKKGRPKKGINDPKSKYIKKK